MSRVGLPPPQQPAVKGVCVCVCVCVRVFLFVCGCVYVCVCGLSPLPR